MICFRSGRSGYIQLYCIAPKSGTATTCIQYNIFITLYCIVYIRDNKKPSLSGGKDLLLVHSKHPVKHDVTSQAENPHKADNVDNHLDKFLFHVYLPARRAIALQSHHTTLMKFKTSSQITRSIQFKGPRRPLEFIEGTITLPGCLKRV